MFHRRKFFWWGLSRTWFCSFDLRSAFILERQFPLQNISALGCASLPMFKKYHLPPIGTGLTQGSPPTPMQLPRSSLSQGLVIPSRMAQPSHTGCIWTLQVLQSQISCGGCGDTMSEWVKVAQLCLTLCDPMDYRVHGILQAKILEWVALSFSRGFSQPRNRTQVSHISGRFFTSWATREAQFLG